MNTEKYLPFRGNIQAIKGQGSNLYLAARHPENHPVGVWVIDLEKIKLTQIPVKCGTTALAVSKDTVWAAGDDNKIYKFSGKGKPAPTGPELVSPATDMILLSENRLGVLAENEILILSRKNGNLLQTLELPETGTAFSADDTGSWIAAGTSGGTISVFECEDKNNFAISESEKIHQGAVNAVTFVKKQLKFISAGTDQQIFITYARGKLEPEDRAKGAGHTDRVHALISGDLRFYSGSMDKTVKSWDQASNIKPFTLKDRIRKVIGLSLITIEKHPHLAVAFKDNSIQCYPLDEQGKPGELAVYIGDAYAQAESDIKKSDPVVREKALKKLADFNDNRAMLIIGSRIAVEPDPGLQKTATRLLGDSGHPKADTYLVQYLKHKSEPVRIEALTGLRKLKGESDTAVLDLALKAGHTDIGVMAVAALEKLAAKDEEAKNKLFDSLDSKIFDIRLKALESVESMGNAKDSEQNIAALKSKQADIRKMSLVRLFQKKLTTRPEVQAALRRMIEDSDAQVRQSAFLISVAASKKLAHALRTLDSEIHAQLFEIESADIFQKKKQAKSPELPKIKKDNAAKLVSALKPKDYAPLLQAMSARTTETSLAGALGLACLGDIRAFGLLMQLSREPDPAIKTTVCRALGLLEDPRGIRILRTFLNQDIPEVRDSAFSALCAVYSKNPLASVADGLNSSHADIRHRGLQILTAHIRKTKKIEDQSLDLLIQALNDPDPGVRSEAFKACLNLNAGGSENESLKLVLNSSHPDIRQEVLTEIMTMKKSRETDELIKALINDPDTSIRRNTFKYLMEQADEKDISHLELARQSTHSDIRLTALDHLITKKTKSAQELIAGSLKDEDIKIRLRALDALIDLNAEKNLLKALESKHKDVRAGAATALARQGNSTALDPLLELIKTAEPLEKEEKNLWIESVKKALEGIAELGDSKALDAVLPLLENEEPHIRNAAVRALPWICALEDNEVLEKAVLHKDPDFRSLAAFGLAVNGNPLARSLVFTKEALMYTGHTKHLAAVLALDGISQNKKDIDQSPFVASEEYLPNLLDHTIPELRYLALAALMLREQASFEDIPRRCIACLSAAGADIRLTAAAALSAFEDQNRFLDFILDLINSRKLIKQGKDQPWNISKDSIQDLAAILTYGSSRMRARCAWILWTFTEKKQDAWNQQWPVFASRYKSEIAQAQKEAQKAAKQEFNPDRSFLKSLCFGAYVGLAREKEVYPPENTIRTRQKALKQILNMAENDSTYIESAIPVFIQAMRDPNQPVRIQAFEHLQVIGTISGDIGPEDIGAEALASGFTDLGVLALKLLTEKKSAKAGDALFKDIMLTRTDGLEIEIAKLRQEYLPLSQVAQQAFEAASRKLRIQAVAWLSDAYPQDKDAAKGLVKALSSKFLDIKVRAALSLGYHKDSHAFDALAKLLNDTRTISDSNLNQKQIIKALSELGRPETGDLFMDRMVNDPSGNAEKERLFTNIGRFRNPEHADRVLGFMEKPEFQKFAFETLFMISGYDQPNLDPEEQRPDKSWMEKQYPRNDEVLVKLVKKCIDLNVSGVMIARLIPEARWVKSPEIDPLLAQLVSYPDDTIRFHVIEAAGWRMRKRSGPSDMLVQNLEHKDPVTRFLAAEALAKAGNDRGISILLASVDLMDDIRFRMRAVLALGELADEQALELLLKLAADEGHALQESALEAIGHMGRSEDKKDEIFNLLEKYSKEDGGLARMALNGLRWFNTSKGWELIRKKAADTRFMFRHNAVTLLGYNDDPATRDLLMELIRNDEDVYAVNMAFQAARMLWPAENMQASEPDYALLQSRWPELDKDALKRVCSTGETEAVLSLISHCRPNIRSILETELTGRSPLPVEAAAKEISSPFPETVSVSARILGLAARKKDSKLLEIALNSWSEKLNIRTKEIKEKGNLPDTSIDAALNAMAECTVRLVWASGKTGVNAESILAAAHNSSDDTICKPVRIQAINALGQYQKTKKITDFLIQSVSDPDADIRRNAVESLCRIDSKAGVEAAEALLSDRPGFNRAAASVDIGKILYQGEDDIDVHIQGIILPHIIRQGKLDAVSQIAANDILADRIRLGAVEALAKMADEKAEKYLIKVGESQETDKELKKAAWRGLRRSQRARLKKLSAS